MDSPCIVYVIASNKENIKQYIKELPDRLEEDADVEEFIEKYVTPCIVDDVLYEVENF